MHPTQPLATHSTPSTSTSIRPSAMRSHTQPRASSSSSVRFADLAGPSALVSSSEGVHQQGHANANVNANGDGSAEGDVMRMYEEKRDRLSKAITSSLYLLGDLRNFNEKEWTIRYPLISAPTEASRSLGESSSSATSTSSQGHPRRPGMAARTVTMTFADAPDVGSRTVRMKPTRSMTTVSPVEGSQSTDANHNAEDLDMAPADFSVLRLDAAQSLMSSLERGSISRLISSRLESSLSHLSSLQSRIMSTSSRVLVTGDLNAGKSTLVNALLRRGGQDEDGWPTGIMPVDQQPLTARFVEVLSDGAKTEEVTGGEERIHVITDKEEKYDPTDSSTYETRKLEDLQELALEPAADQPPLKVYLRQPSKDLANPSILHNGILDISLIDAPGLNRDVIHTTATFTRQPSIDVVIFVVSAANHFTLSAKEFILSAGREKARMFIVVNRFDEVRDKEKCKRVVLEQIKKLSPLTYEERDELVHFVDSATIALRYAENVDDTIGDMKHKNETQLDAAFAHLEQSLRSFVLVNRAKSKLGPAENYLTHLLADVGLLASANAIIAEEERDRARLRLSQAKPLLDTMRKGRDGLEASLDEEEDKLVEKVRATIKEGIHEGLNKVGRGQLAAIPANIRVPSYPGLLGVWDYAAEVRRTYLRSLDLLSQQLQEETRRLTTVSVASVSQLGDQYLPTDVPRSERVFNPDAMFASQKSSLQTSRRKSVPALGLGLASRPELLQVNISDLLDLHHHVLIVKDFVAKQEKRDSSALIPAPIVGVASAAAGALTLYGGKLLSAKYAFDSVVSITQLANNKVVQKWALPVIGAVVIGTGVYIIYDLPRSIPRNIGRQLQIALETTEYPDAEATRMTREARKVVRLASWDLRERFRAALEEKSKDVREGQDQERQSSQALEWFEGIQDRVHEIRAEMDAKDLKTA